MQTVAALNVAPARVAFGATAPKQVARGSVVARDSSPSKSKTPGDALACALFDPPTHHNSGRHDPWLDHHMIRFAFLCSHSLVLFKIVSALSLTHTRVTYRAIPHGRTLFGAIHAHLAFAAFSHLRLSTAIPSHFESFASMISIAQHRCCARLSENVYRPAALKCSTCAIRISRWIF